jgi:hypothetical protein
MINVAALLLALILVGFEWLRRSPKAIAENESTQTSAG